MPFVLDEPMQVPGQPRVVFGDLAQGIQGKRPPIGRRTYGDCVKQRLLGGLARFRGLAGSTSRTTSGGRSRWAPVCWRGPMPFCPTNPMSAVDVRIALLAAGSRTERITPANRDRGLRSMRRFRVADATGESRRGQEESDDHQEIEQRRTCGEGESPIHCRHYRHSRAVLHVAPTRILGGLPGELNTPRKSFRDNEVCRGVPIVITHCTYEGLRSPFDSHGT